MKEDAQPLAYIRAINFDLNTKHLKVYYPSRNILGYKKAYRDIKRFLQKNGFSHRQWSGYVSKEPLTNYQVSDIVNRLSIKFPWLSKCVEQFDVTNISNTYSMLDTIHNAQNPLVNINNIAQPIKLISKFDEETNKTQVLSIDEKLAQAQEKANQRNKALSESELPHRTKNNSIEIK